ncbi:MAG: ATP-binding protein [Gammaproteobacteria bacterium]|nr:ATP-binding protein [Gammaproteobacteria bacterium]
MSQRLTAGFAASEPSPPLPLLDQSVERLQGVVEHLHATLDAAQMRHWQEAPLPTKAAALLDSLPAGVLLIDSTGHVAACNREARELLGPALLGKAWASIVKTHLAASEDATELVLVDGRRLSVATRPMSNTSGQVVMLSDVSETRALQRLLSRRSRLAELGEMLARLAHQLGTPLATSALYAHELCHASGDPQRNRELARRIEQSLGRLRSQIRDMQVFTSTAVVAGTVTEVDKLLSAFSDLVCPAFEAANAMLQIDSQAGQSCVQVNAPALASVFANLADNALQACPQGLRFNVGVAASGDTVDFTFADNGPGVTTEIAAQMFEAFFTTREQGTGLGLAVAKSVVEAHGGSIRHDAAAPGCRIVVELPRVAADAARGQR